MTALIFLVLVLVTGAMAGQDFVPLDRAQVVVLTHEALLTPGWRPGMSPAWETHLLRQKAKQGLSTGLLSIPDGFDQYEIRERILTEATHAQYLYIIGDAHRPPDVECCDSTWLPRRDTIQTPRSDARSGNFVPAWYIANPYWSDWGVYDVSYVDSLSCLVGRLPAENSGEIENYLAKVDEYVAVTDTPLWTKRILFFGDDVDFWFNHGNGQQAREAEADWRQWVVPEWYLDSLHTSWYQGIRDEPVRHQLFERRVNEGQAIITLIGPRSSPRDFENWYNGECAFNFTNRGAYPLIVCAMSDNLGFDEWRYPTQAEGCAPPPHEMSCVAERLLLMPNAGCIAAIGATTAINMSLGGRWGEGCFAAIMDEHERNFARICEWGRAWLTPHRQMGTGQPGYMTYIPPDFLRYELLGDPTVGLPSQTRDQPQKTKEMEAQIGVVRASIQELLPR